MARRRFSGRLPAYRDHLNDFTSNQKVFINRWEEFMEPLKALGCVIRGFSPGVSFTLWGTDHHEIDEETLWLLGRLFKGESFDDIRKDIEGTRARLKAEKDERDRIERLREENPQAWFDELRKRVESAEAERRTKSRAGTNARRNGPKRVKVLRKRRGARASPVD